MTSQARRRDRAARIVDTAAVVTTAGAVAAAVGVATALVPEPAPPPQPSPAVVRHLDGDDLVLRPPTLPPAPAPIPTQAHGAGRQQQPVLPRTSGS